MLPGDDRTARRVLTVCLAAGVTTLLDQSVLNIAVPELRESLSAGATDVQWIVSGYSLACARHDGPPDKALAGGTTIRTAGGSDPGAATPPRGVRTT